MHARQGETLRHDARIGLDALDVPELAKEGKQHAVAAADVENRGVASRAEHTRRDLSHQIIARSPPPVAGRQITLSLGVRRIHGGLR